MTPKNPNLRPLAFIIFAVVSLLTLIGYNIALNSIPGASELRFLAPGASSYAISSSINSLWVNGAYHVRRIDAAGKSPLTDLLRQARDNLSQKCIVIDDAKDLNTLGIDTSRGFAFATYSPPLPTLAPGAVRWLAVIPVADAPALQRTIDKLLVASSDVTLSSPDKAITAIRIGTLKHSATVSLCTEDGESVHSGQILVSPNGVARLHLNASGTDKSEFLIDCTALDAAHREHACGCPEAQNWSNPSTTCRISVSPTTQAAGKTKLLVDGRTIKTARVGDFTLAFPSDNIGVIGEDVALIQDSLSHLKENDKAHDHDDALIAAQQILARKRPGATDGWIAGGIRLPRPASSSGMSFVTTIAPHSVGFFATISLDPTDAAVVARMLKPSTADPESMPNGAVGELASSDPGLLGLYRYAETWLPSLYTSVNHELGGFAPVIHAIEGKDVASLRLIMLGLREGIPDLALAVKMDRAVADQVVLDLQKLLRGDRDGRILLAALNKYNAQNLPAEKAEEGSGTQAIEDETITKLLGAGLLAPESDALWTRYRYRDGKFQATLNATDFASASYQFQLAGYSGQFVMPRASQNDFDYHIFNAQVAEKTFAQDRFRLASIYFADDRSLWFGTDKATLVTALNDGLYRSRSRLCAIPGNSQNRSKIMICLAPNLLASQGRVRNIPSNSTTSFAGAAAKYQTAAAQARWWASHYRSLVLTIGTSQGGSELAIEGDIE
jgi:hypothetical protein